MSQKGHRPMRMCMGCRTRKGKEQLIRFVRGSNGAMILAGRGYMTGRGFYLCPRSECFKRAQRKVGVLPEMKELRLPEERSVRVD